jgi:N-methylhydantoinase A
MLYLGQTHTVAVPVEVPVAGLTRDDVRVAFEAAYSAAYGRLLENIPMRVMNYRIAVVGRRPGLDMAVFAPVDGRPADACRTGDRRVYVDGAFHEAGVYDRLDLAVGEVIEGPALLEQPDTTIFVDPGLSARVDAFGNLVIKPSGELS